MSHEQPSKRSPTGLSPEQFAIITCAKKTHRAWQRARVGVMRMKRCAAEAAHDGNAAGAATFKWLAEEYAMDAEMWRAITKRRLKAARIIEG